MEQTRKEQLIVQGATEVVAPLQGPAVPPDAAELPGDLSGLRGLLRAVIGCPAVPTGADWEMSMFRIFTRLGQLETLVSAKFADFGPRLDLASLALTQLQASDAAQTAQLQFVAAKEELTAAATTANTLAITALQRQQQADEAAAALQQAKLTADETTIAQLQQQFNTLQFALTAAQNSAAAASAKADATADAAKVAKAAADAAQATATTAQTNYTALAGRFRTVRVSTPAVAIGGTMTIQLTWPTPFADDKYNVAAELEGLAFLGLTAVVTNRTATGCTVSVKNTLGLQLLAGAGMLTVTAIHDQ